jgi:3-hydroxybutyryl-CoA dehydrogenase
MRVKKAGVIGAGVIGKGVSQTLAQAGFQVVLLDLFEDSLENAKREIEEAIRLQGLFKNTGNTENPDKVLGRIVFSTDYQELSDVDLAIENVTEKWKIKKEVYINLINHG